MGQASQRSSPTLPHGRPRCVSTAYGGIDACVGRPFRNQQLNTCQPPPASQSCPCRPPVLPSSCHDPTAQLAARLSRSNMANERSSAPSHARNAPPPASQRSSAPSLADSSVLGAGGPPTPSFDRSVPDRAAPPETVLPSVARDHGPARGSDSGRWMCAPASALSAAAVRLTTTCATRRREDWGRPSAWGPIRLPKTHATSYQGPALSASRAARPFCSPLACPALHCTSRRARD